VGLHLYRCVRAHCYPIDELRAKYPDAEIFKDYGDFLPTIDRRYMQWEGKRIGYVICANVMAMFYRKDLWEDPKIKDMYRKWIDKNLADLQAKAPEIGLDPKKIPTELKVLTVLEDVYAIGKFFTKKFNPDLARGLRIFLRSLLDKVYKCRDP